MKSIYFSFVLVLALLSVSPFFSQRDGSVRGRLQDTAARQPVPDATITLLNAKDSSLVTFSRSGSSGSFLLKGLGPGSYHLHITHIVYRTVVRSFVLTALVKNLD